METKKYKLLSALRYLGDGFFYPFFSLYLVTTGLTEAKIGFLLSIAPLLAIIMNPIYMKICKTLKLTRNTLGIICILEGLMIGAIGFTTNYLIITILTTLLAIFGSCHYGLMDGLFSVYAEENDVTFSSLRIFGSAAYIIATTLAGYLCKTISYKYTFVIGTILFIISGILYFLLKPITINKDEKEEQDKTLALFKNKKYTFFVVLYALLMAAIISTNNFLGTYFETRGVDASQYGIIYSYFVLFEVITIIVLNIIEKKKNKIISNELLLVVASICAFIKIAICYFDLPLEILVPLTGFRGIGYGILLHVSWRYIISLVNEKNGSIGVMLCTLCYSIVYFILHNIGGNIIEIYSYNLYHLIAMAIVFISFILSIILLIIARKKKDDALLEPHHDALDKNFFLEDHPRSRLKRDSFINLNTVWDLQISNEDKLPTEYPYKIRVPFCIESSASGINREIKQGELLFYRYVFKYNILTMHHEQLILHFEGVDQEATVYVNGVEVITHKGGYTPFEVDIKPYINTNLKEMNEIVVKVKDDLDKKYPYGKQERKHGGMWYTPVSGIYKPVWMESLHVNHFTNVRFDVNIKTQKVTVITEGNDEDKVIIISKDSYEVYRTMYKGNSITLSTSAMELWSPDTPNIYDVLIRSKSDKVYTYFACRDIKQDEKCFTLNGEKIFINGLLYQPYYSEGLLTPLSYESYYDDIMLAKSLGYNTLRVHISIPTEIFYETCDRLGMMVIQDMVNNGPYDFYKDTVRPTIRKNVKDDMRNNDKEAQEIFKNTMIENVNNLKFYPCIIMWTIFNEGWGQFNSEENYNLLSSIDDTRLIDVTSGWFDTGINPINSKHIYFKKLKKSKDSRPYFISEFGGYSLRIKEHIYNKRNNYGYKLYKNKDSLEKGIIDLYENEVIPLYKKGLAGAIYTELNDVEDETNGFITYDRQVVKVDVNNIRKVMEQLK